HGVGDLGADLIVSNPPYLPTGLVPELFPEGQSHEPSLAPDGGGDGPPPIRRIAVQARRVLRPSGVLVVETAGDVQAAAAATLLRAEDFARVEAGGPPPPRPAACLVGGGG